MSRHFALALAFIGCLSASSLGATPATRSTVSGTYLESRTCQVYTGPCFANGESGLAGRSAIMAWNVEQGQHAGVDISGLHVIVVVNAANTIGFQGLQAAEELKSVILVDEKADASQREALIQFARQHAGPAGRRVLRVDPAPITMQLDVSTLEGSLRAGKQVAIKTRKARPDDCICGNEAAYYPPLVRLENFAAGISIENRFTGRGLGVRWSAPDSRSAYMATFSY